MSAPSATPPSSSKLTASKLTETSSRNWETHAAYAQAEITLPGKFFILGEYAVLKGASALLMASQSAQNTGFSARVSPQSKFEFNELHTASPAGRLLEWAYERFGLGFKIEWRDGFVSTPMRGLGSSTAEFTQSQKGESPSGADLLIQWLGGSAQISIDHTHVRPRVKTLQAHEDCLRSLLVFSGAHQAQRKVATHDHLGTLRLSSRLKLLRELTAEGIEAWTNGEVATLGRAMNRFGDTLSELGLEVPVTSEDRKALSAVDGVFGVKGSGALQADLILVCADPIAHDAVLEVARTRDLNLLKRETQNVSGLHFDALKRGPL